MSKKPNPVLHMRRALHLAEMGRGFVLPNPMVGAVIIKDGKRIAEGYHRKYGGKHAEVEAMKACKLSLGGSTLYVTLEPCCHFGKTAPCTDAIIRSGIKHVVIATLDPSPKINGKSLQILKNAGIKVELGLLEQEAKLLNRDFFTFHTAKRPYITIKAAPSLDGKIAVDRNQKTLLTGEEAQKRLHELRREHQAILVGAGTILADDPHLGVRLVAGASPLRIILTGSRVLPKNAQVFRDNNFLLLKKKSVKEIIHELYEKGIISVLVEGGHEVFQAFLSEGIYDKLILFYAPIILGKSALPFTHLNKTLHLKQESLEKLGQDWMLTLAPEQTKSSSVHKKPEKCGKGDVHEN